MLDTTRHREQLLQALTPEGLEDLTLRLVRPDYPKAHRTGRGGDGGIDVVSDYERPPQRAWQAKNVVDVDWSKCTASLDQGMNGLAPAHYTFVFPRRLKTSELDHWRDEFLPRARERYEQLEELDYWDDLAERLEGRADLMNQLTDEALAGYVRRTFVASGVNPLASAPDLVTDAESAANHAIEVGENDPNFAYSTTGGEVSAVEAEMPENRVQLTIKAGHQDETPRWALAIRQGEKVMSLSATPRDPDTIEHPKPWFDASEEGQTARLAAQVSLAKGKPIRLESESVGLAPATIPDRFREMVQADGRLKQGVLEIGLSEPEALTLAIETGETGEPDFQIELSLYRVPEDEGQHRAFAAAFHGFIFIFGFTDEPEQERTFVDLSAILDLFGDTAGAAVSTIALMQLMERSERMRFQCPGLFPKEGFVAPIPNVSGNAPPLEKLSTIAYALSRLNYLDEGERTLPAQIDERDFVVASMVIRLLEEGTLEIHLDNENDFPLPEGTSAKAEPADFNAWETPVPGFAGQITGLVVRHSLHEATPVAVVPGPATRVRLRVRPDSPDATFRTTLIEGA